MENTNIMNTVAISDPTISNLTTCMIREFKRSNGGPVTTEEDIASIRDGIIRMISVVSTSYNYEDISRDIRLREDITRRLQEELFTSFRTYTIREDIVEDAEWFTKAIENNREGIGTRWGAYKAYLLSQGFSDAAITSIDKASNQLMNNIANPKYIEDSLAIYREDTYRNIGLVIGDVQSGKTTIMLSTVNKALDSGYKLIIIVAGTSSELRNQLQKRAEEGCLGRNTITPDIIGLGENLTEAQCEDVLMHTRRDELLESGKVEDGELVTKGVKGLKIPSGKQVILVVKRNHKVTERLIKFVESQNKYDKEEDKLKNTPTLIIADEADEATINTGKDLDITKNNKLIRILLSKIQQVNYIGFTATGFANIYINPNENDAEIGGDLFPRDFIIYVEPSATYVGAKEFFERINSPYVKKIKDDIPFDRKNFSNIPDELFNSLEKSIDNFLFVGAIKYLRGFGNTHNSMLIHVDRKTVPQNFIKEYVNGYLDRLRRAVASGDYSDFRQSIDDLLDESIERTEDVKEMDAEKGVNYSYNLDFEGEEIFQAVVNYLTRQDENGDYKLKVREVNSTAKGEKLDYDKHENGLHVIAIGGQCLSRGFTLEGLSITYLLRESVTMDTLLQMCRFFSHYKPAYRDLVRLYTTEKIIEVMKLTTTGSYCLVDQIKQMEHNGEKPLDFGLYMEKVRTRLIDRKLILPTARNKMRKAVVIERNGVAEGNFEGNLFEMATFYRGERGNGINEENLLVLNNLITRLQENEYKNFEEDESLVWNTEDLSLVEDFINSIEIPIESRILNKVRSKALLINRINQAREEGKIESADIVIINNFRKRDLDIEGENFTALQNPIYPINRKVSIGETEGNSIRYYTEETYCTAYGRSTQSRDLHYGLTNEEIEAIELESGRSFTGQKPPENEYSNKYRTIGKRALILIYLQNAKQITNSGREGGIFSQNEEVRVTPISFSFFFPGEIVRQNIHANAAYYRKWNEIVDSLQRGEI